MLLFQFGGRILSSLKCEMYRNVGRQRGGKVKISNRAYSLLMASANIGAATVCMSLARINVLAGSEHLWVTVLAAVMVSVFFVIAAGWSLDALEPGVLRKLMPWHEVRLVNDDRALFEVPQRQGMVTVMASRFRFSVVRGMGQPVTP
jgi:hypothetical protein